jgi:hypothetical protein
MQNKYDKIMKCEVCKHKHKITDQCFNPNSAINQINKKIAELRKNTAWMKDSEESEQELSEFETGIWLKGRIYGLKEAKSLIK